MRQLLNYPFDAILILCLLALVLIQMLTQARHRAQAEVICLQVAADAHRMYFKHAEAALNAEQTPKQVKNVLIHLMDAMTDEVEGRKALDALIKAIDSVDAKAPASVNELKQFREAAPEQYESFLLALRAAMTGLLTAYGPQHLRVELEYKATLDQVVTYALAKRIGDFLTGLAPNQSYGGVRHA